MITSLRLSRASSIVRSWAIAPGSSLTQPTIQPLSSANMAVYVVVIDDSYASGLRLLAMAGMNGAALAVQPPDKVMPVDVGRLMPPWYNRMIRRATACSRRPPWRPELRGIALLPWQRRGQLVRVCQPLLTEAGILCRHWS